MDIQEFMVDRDQHMRPLEYDLSENFNELLRYMQDMGILDNVPVGVTSESEVVSISDAYPAPPRALNVYGKSTQDGTPTPDAPVPILSVDDLSLVLAGKNLFDANNAFLLNGYFDTSGHIRPNANFRTVAIKVVPNTTYALQLTRFTSQSATNLSMWLFNETPETSTSGVHGTRVITFTYPTTVSGGYHYEGQITTDADTKYICISIGNITDYDVSASLATLQLELGSTATAYEPYQGTTVPDLLPEGTSLRSLPDGTRDTLSLSYLRPSAREGWAWYSRELVQRCKRLTRAIADMVDVPVSSSLIIPGWQDTGISDGFTTPSYIFSSTKCYCNIKTGQIAAGYQTQNRLALRDNYGYGFTTAAEWKAAYPDLTFVLDYPLVTPVTTTLDPIELPVLPAPTATVWCDGGNAQPTVMLEYVKDASAAIADLSEAIADIVSG